MDVETSILQMNLPGLAILAAIGVVTYAIWGDYLERQVRWMEQKKIEHDLNEEVSSLRVIGIFYAIFQLMLFFASSQVRTEHPFLGNLIFLSAILTQGITQAMTERRIRGRMSLDENKARFRELLKSGVGVVIAAVSYLGVVFGVLAASVLLASVVTKEPAIRMALVLAGSLGGLVGGLVFNFALAPWHLKNILSVNEMTGQWREQVRQLFEKTRMRLPLLYVIEQAKDRASSSTLFVSGWRRGRGWFTPALFISHSALEALTPEELNAVLAHEVSHIQLKHIPKRLWTACLLVCGTVLVGVCLIVFARFAMPPEQSAMVRDWLAPAMALLSFWLAMQWMGNQNRAQELEADWHAVKNLGASFEAFASALRKLDAMNGLSTLKEGIGHPASERRIFILATKIEMAKGKQENRKAA